MCTMIVEGSKVEGFGKGPNGWFGLERAFVSYDHPFHLPEEHSVNIDFVNESLGPGARVSVELTEASARSLVAAIGQALERFEKLPV